MTLRRRTLLQATALAALAPTVAQAADYRALVVVFLTGGNDGHNCLVPTDGAYSDYQRARTNLALSRDSLVKLPNPTAGHTFGVHPALSPLVPAYTQGRLAWLANVGPLVEPATGAQVRDNAVQVPPFLLSHSEAVLLQQGWTVKDDLSGWAGRGIERLPLALRHPLNAITAANERTLVQGRSSAPAFLDPFALPQHFGWADLLQPDSLEVQALRTIARRQSANAYAQEYLRTFERMLEDSALMAKVSEMFPQPTQDFGTHTLGEQLRRLARMLPGFKASGYRRQVFLVQWGAFDTHAAQRGSATTTQDYQLTLVAQAVAAFDQALQAAGLGQDVVTLQMSDFGRTLRPGSGGGSEHAWGNHLFALGGPVAGGQVVGTFPDLTLGGPDDGDVQSNGRHVPTISTDQLGATLMQWLGLDASQFHDVFPWLVNFAQKTVPGLLRS